MPNRRSHLRTDAKRPSWLQGASALAPDVDLALALFTYAAASATDFLLTFPGLLSKEIRELNPFLNAYIVHFGEAWGLLLPKLILGLLVIVTTSLYLHAKHRQHLTRMRPQYILYGGAMFTLLAPLHWVILKEWDKLLG